MDEPALESSAQRHHGHGTLGIVRLHDVHGSCRTMFQRGHGILRGNGTNLVRKEIPRPERNDTDRGRLTRALQKGADEQLNGPVTPHGHRDAVGVGVLQLLT